MALFSLAGYSSYCTTKIKAVGISAAFCTSKVLRVNGIEASMWCKAWHCGVVKPPMWPSWVLHEYHMNVHFNTWHYLTHLGIWIWTSSCWGAVQLHWALQHRLPCQPLVCARHPDDPRCKSCRIIAAVPQQCLALARPCCRVSVAEGGQLRQGIATIYSFVGCLPKPCVLLLSALAGALTLQG